MDLFWAPGKPVLDHDLKHQGDFPVGQGQIIVGTPCFFHQRRTHHLQMGRTEPEKFYHGFVLGLMVDLSDRYLLRSNRESGFGRYDVMLEPKRAGEDAFILEFKVFVHDRILSS